MIQTQQDRLEEALIRSKVPRVYVAVSFYNEIDFLKDCFESVKRFNLPIIGVDGAYELFPHNRPYSTDGSLEIANEYCERVISRCYAWKSQVEKRNIYLQHYYGDLCLVLDADERLVEYSFVDKGEDAYCVNIKNMAENYVEPHYRIFKPHLKLSTKHYWKKPTINKEGVCLDPTQEILIEHFKHLRSDIRKEAKQQYYEMRKE